MRRGREIYFIKETKTMKKTLAILLAAIMLLGMCSFASAEPKTYKVGVSIYQFTDNFMTLYRNEIEAYFKSLETDEVKYEIIMADGKNDMAEQTNQIRNFITQGVDVIILNLVQTSSADAVIDEIVAADIPLVLINREPLAYDADGNTLDEAYEGILNNAKVCYVGADARQSGTFQGEMVAELDNHGDINGDGKISYIMIEGDPENIDAQYRTEFSIKALKDAGYEVECLDDQVGNWDQTKGQELCANALTAYGDKIEVVFLEEAVQLVKDGEMTGTVLNDHIGQSHAAVDVAVKLLNGEPIDNYYWVDYVKVNKAYVDAM